MSPIFDSPVVSTQWLADHLGSPSLVVVDASMRVDGEGKYRSGIDAYLETGHIPGARFADLLGSFSHPDAPGERRPEPDALAIAIASLGITEDSRVVVYDDERGRWAARLWWLLRAAGIDQVAVLDGGLKAWQVEHRSVETGAIRGSSSDYLPTPRPELWASRPLAEAAVRGEERITLVSGARSAVATRELGAESVGIPLNTITRASDHTLVPDARLREIYSRALGANRPIITVDGEGFSASAHALALSVAGARDVRVLDGRLPLSA